MSTLKTLSAPPRYDDATCAVDGCTRPTRTWSRWCTNHARQRHRTGDVNGRILKPREVAAHRELAEIFLERRKGHPAVIAAEEWAAALLHDNVRLPERVQEHLSRLRDYETTPREILVAILGVYGVTAQYPNAFVSDVTKGANLGRAVMGLRPLPQTTAASGRRYAVTPPAKVAAALGEVIAREAGLWATTFWRTIDAALRESQNAASRLKVATEELWRETNEAQARLPDPDRWKTLTIEGARKWAEMNQESPRSEEHDPSEDEQ